MGSPIKFEKAPKAETTEEKLPVITEESVSEGNRGYITESVSPEINEPYSEGAFKNYTVQKNDTLQKISKKYYGTTKKWHQIYEANKDILKTPDRLYVGQILKIPVIKKELKEPAEKLK
ncbi:MAG: LysM peptidoglycan-binding domain-containing protein [Candidatus Omnitrophica bacterium]|nr:LysM peptidoglycan-binding domain-containing protein [Candidatus Omnitrophota bacterium]